MASVLGEKGDERLDCVVRLMTPERIIVVHPLAGPFRRFAAYLIDLGLLICLALALLVAFLSSRRSRPARRPPRGRCWWHFLS